MNKRERNIKYWNDKAKKYVKTKRMKVNDNELKEIAQNIKREYYSEYQKKNKERISRYNRQYYLNRKYLKRDNTKENNKEV